MKTIKQQVITYAMQHPEQSVRQIATYFKVKYDFVYHLLQSQDIKRGAVKVDCNIRAPEVIPGVAEQDDAVIEALNRLGKADHLASSKKCAPVYDEEDERIALAGVWSVAAAIKERRYREQRPGKVRLRDYALSELGDIYEAMGEVGK